MRQQTIPYFISMNYLKIQQDLLTKYQLSNDLHFKTLPDSHFTWYDCKKNPSAKNARG